MSRVRSRSVPVDRLVSGSTRCPAAACTESTRPGRDRTPSAALSPADQALALQKIAQLNAQVTAFRMSGDITSNKAVNALSKYRPGHQVRGGDAAAASAS
jgi:hypothetical protein